MVRLQVVDVGWHLIRRVDENIWIKQSQTADKGWSSSLVFEGGAIKFSRQSFGVIQSTLQGLGLGGMGSVDWIDLTVIRDSLMALVNEVMNLQVP